MTVLTVTGDDNVEITSLTKDSREVRPGCLFFVTESNERFLSDVAGKGVSAVVSDRYVTEAFPAVVMVSDVTFAMGEVAARFYDNPSEKLHVTGVTGTNGKTTVTYLIESILYAGRKNPGVIGTIAYRYGGRSFEAKNTTPGAIELQALLDDMVAGGTDHAVMEVSSHALHQHRVERIAFDVAVFTNLTHDHLDYHGSFDRYRDAKAMLFHYYLHESGKKARYAILNRDDPHVSSFIPGEGVSSLFFSTTGEADASLTGMEESVSGMKLEVILQGTAVTVQTSLIGSFNASNILAAMLCGVVCGCSIQEIVRGISVLDGVPGRLERVRSTNGVFIFVDYAHTPDALERVLTILGDLKRGRLIVVFGCGGDRDREKRPIMGRLAAKHADIPIVTSDNPRSEDPLSIIDEITAGMEGEVFEVIADRREAIFRAVGMAKEGDILLVAGKGHEDYQVVGETVFHFSDKEVIREALGVVTG